jgi:hypothetical protein
MDDLQERSWVAATSLADRTLPQLGASVAEVVVQRRNCKRSIARSSYIEKRSLCTGLKVTESEHNESEAIDDEMR